MAAFPSPEVGSKAGAVATGTGSRSWPQAFDIIRGLSPSLRQPYLERRTLEHVLTENGWVRALPHGPVRHGVWFGVGLHGGDFGRCGVLD